MASLQRINCWPKDGLPLSSVTSKPDDNQRAGGRAGPNPKGTSRSQESQRGVEAPGLGGGGQGGSGQLQAEPWQGPEQPHL